MLQCYLLVVLIHTIVKFTPPPPPPKKKKKKRKIFKTFPDSERAMHDTYMVLADTWLTTVWDSWEICAVAVDSHGRF